MKCPSCNNPNLVVQDSRDSEDGVKRRRCCMVCRKRWVTIESITEEYVPGVAGRPANPDKPEKPVRVTVPIPPKPKAKANTAARRRIEELRDYDYEQDNTIYSADEIRKLL